MGALSPNPSRNPKRADQNQKEGPIAPPLKPSFAHAWKGRKLLDANLAETPTFTSSRVHLAGIREKRSAGRSYPDGATARSMFGYTAAAGHS